MDHQDDVTGADAGAAALEEVADTADATAREQRQAAVLARRLAGRRRRGLSWADLTAEGGATQLVELLGAGALRLRGAAGALRQLVARGLAAEGMTTRRIGERFGVSHQRVSSILSDNERT